MVDRNAEGRLLRRTGIPWRMGLPLLGLVLLAVSACGGGPPELPSPRPIIVFSGERIHADSTEMLAVDRWTRRVQVEIGEDESLAMEIIRDENRPPWDAVDLDPEGPAGVFVPRRSSEAETPYRIYAFLQMMDERGELGEWLRLREEEEPVEVPDDPFMKEKAIVDRVAAVWLLGRAIFDTAPFGLLDQVVYAREFGYLEAYLLTARSEEFTEERERWLAEEPGAQEEYREWFRNTFEEDPPGWEDVAEEAEDGGGSL